MAAIMEKDPQAAATVDKVAGAQAEGEAMRKTTVQPQQAANDQTQQTDQQSYLQEAAAIGDAVKDQNQQMQAEQADPAQYRGLDQRGQDITQGNMHAPAQGRGGRGGSGRGEVTPDPTQPAPPTVGGADRINQSQANQEAAAEQQGPAADASLSRVEQSQANQQSADFQQDREQQQRDRDKQRDQGQELE